eukprot:Gregarina_sp_Poly_1__4034@NODE_221_length_11248_cov_177_758072_g195_i0_p2_GENE_NODE_221_length_11248_cov_177_758072_g195_i0NODE_221_length_11248_cov_177_758072_g195_i0_p2_ORF_typecomplete_len602_score98_15UCH/PF00443_29/0_00026UCH/PF00443_29/5UCH/PF00443_29/1_1e03DUF3276/PF11680_8/0_11Baculo_PEP_C/PF04513_12/0_1DUF1515/PF07439_11/0_3_NODE_221_length_11248_cov_177_758072_g195_i020513856
MSLLTAQMTQHGGKYTLMAVLEHIGHSAMSGHYRAKVRDAGYRQKGIKTESMESIPEDGDASREAGGHCSDDTEVEEDSIASESPKLDVPQLETRRKNRELRGSETPPASFRFPEPAVSGAPQIKSTVETPRILRDTLRAGEKLYFTDYRRQRQRCGFLAKGSSEKRVAPKRVLRAAMETRISAIRSAEQLSPIVTPDLSDTEKRKPRASVSANLEASTIPADLWGSLGGLKGGEKEDAGEGTETESGAIASSNTKRRRLADSGEQNLAALQKFHNRWRHDNTNIISLDDASRHEWIEFDDQCVRVWTPNIEGGSTHSVSEAAYLFVYKYNEDKQLNADFIPTGLLESITDVINCRLRSMENDLRGRQLLHNLCDQMRERVQHLTEALSDTRQRIWDTCRTDLTAILDSHGFIPRLKLQAVLTGQDFDTLSSVFRRQQYFAVVHSSDNPHAGLVVTCHTIDTAKASDENLADRKQIPPAHNECTCPHGKPDILMILDGHYKLVPKYSFQSLGVADLQAANESMCQQCCSVIYSIAMITLEVISIHLSKNQHSSERHTTSFKKPGQLRVGSTVGIPLLIPDVKWSIHLSESILTNYERPHSY